MSIIGSASGRVGVLSWQGGERIDMWGELVKQRIIRERGYARIMLVEREDHRERESFFGEGAIWVGWQNPSIRFFFIFLCNTGYLYLFLIQIQHYSVLLCSLNLLVEFKLLNMLAAAWHFQVKIGRLQTQHCSFGNAFQQGFTVFFSLPIYTHVNCCVWVISLCCFICVLSFLF